MMCTTTVLYGENRPKNAYVVRDFVTQSTVFVQQKTNINNIIILTRVIKEKKEKKIKYFLNFCSKRNGLYNKWKGSALPTASLLITEQIVLQKEVQQWIKNKST